MMEHHVIGIPEIALLAFMGLIFAIPTGSLIWAGIRLAWEELCYRMDAETRAQQRAIITERLRKQAEYAKKYGELPQARVFRVKAERIVLKRGAR